MPEFVLAILKYLFLALIFLFLARAVRAMYLEIAGPRASRGPARERAVPKTRKPPEKLVVTGSDGRSRAYPLEDELIVGRADKCQVVLADSYASQVHARIFRRDSGMFVEDMGSTNGTSLNKKRLTSPMPVYRGDRVRIGKTDLEFK